MHIFFSFRNRTTRILFVNSNLGVQGKLNKMLILTYILKTGLQIINNWIGKDIHLINKSDKSIYFLTATGISWLN